MNYQMALLLLMEMKFVDFNFKHLNPIWYQKLKGFQF